MLAASLLFAIMGVCVKWVSPHFSAPELVFWRGFIALLVLEGWMVWQRQSFATPNLRAHLWRGVAGTLALIASFSAMSLLPLSTAVTLGYTSPLFLAVLLGVWLREPVPRAVQAALVLGFVGLLLLLQPTLQADQWLGALCGLICGVLSAVAYLNVRTLGRLGEPVWRTVFYFSLASTLGGLPWVLSVREHAAVPLDWLGVAGVGLCGLLAQLCLTHAYKHGRALVTASLSYSSVLFSSGLACLLWDEVLPWIAYLGMFFIVVAGIMAMSFSPSPRRAD